MIQGQIEEPINHVGQIWVEADPSWGSANLLWIDHHEWLSILVSLNWFVEHLPQWVLLPALVIGFAGFSLDAGYKWLREKCQPPAKQAES
jgi:hypothetical protein